MITTKKPAKKPHPAARQAARQGKGAIVPHVKHHALVLKNQVTARPGLTATPESVSANALKMATFRERLNVPETTPGTDLVLLIDPQAPLVADIFLRVMPAGDPVLVATGVTLGELQSLLDKLKEMTKTYATAVLLRLRVRDSRQIVARTAKKITDEINVNAQKLLAGNTLTGLQKEELRSDLSRVHAMEAAYRDKLKKLADQTRQATGNEAQAADKWQAREQLVETMIAMKRGEHVDQQQAEAAAATYVELTTEEGTPPPGNRRDRSRLH